MHESAQLIQDLKSIKVRLEMMKNGSEDGYMTMTKIAADIIGRVNDDWSPSMPSRFYKLVGSISDSFISHGITDHIEDYEINSMNAVKAIEAVDYVIKEEMGK